MTRTVISVAFAAGWVVASFAQQDVAQTSAIVTTRHQVTIGATVLRYTARAGTIPIRDNETGDAHANMFFVAYTVERAPGAPPRYDMRILQGTGAGRAGAATGNAGAPRNQILLRYFREDLGFKTGLAHQGLETGWVPVPVSGGSSPNARWIWNQGEAALSGGTDAATRANRAAVGSGDGPPGGSQPWMRRAMALDPRLKLFVAAGRYDSLNSCADNSWTVSRLDPAVAKNISLGCYAGGHMMYDAKAARVSLRDNFAAFVKTAVR